MDVVYLIVRSKILEGPPDEDEARTEALEIDFSRSRPRLRVINFLFRDRGRGFYK